MPSEQAPGTLGPYPSLGLYWRHLFGEPVWRVSLDAGLSCPNRDGTLGKGGCTFCDPASFAPSAGDPRPVSEQLADGMARLRRSRGARRFAAYFQPHTNTYAAPETLERLWDQISRVPEVVALCVGTRPDCVPDPVLDLLARFPDRLDVWLELGLPSARDDTLQRLRRCHRASDFADAAGRAHGRGLRVCAHLILGLPGEGPADEAATAAFVAASGTDGVKLHQLAVVAGTSLEREWREGQVVTLDEPEYVLRAVAFVGALPATTVLHRLVGDTAPTALLAPRYDKGRVVREIRTRLHG
ncbi:MAG: TIGR01212 family radical SAM protein [Deltaproteobacteria bacterium]|nr:TIGR01212 family radical SAM protein [Deltaproteobacteria bacterium]